MNKSAYIAAILAIALTLPVLARGGRGGGGAGGFGGGAGGFGGGAGGAGGFGGGAGGFGGQGGAGGFGRTGNNVGGFNVPAGAAGTGAGQMIAPNGRVQRIQLSAATDDFSILDTTSIFAQNRIARSMSDEIDPLPVAKTQPAGPVSVTAPVFRGVIHDDIGYEAVLEVMSRDGTISNIYSRPKDVLQWDGRTVTDVTWDALVLSNGVKIPLGYNVENQPGLTTVPTPTFVSADAQPAQPAPGAAGATGRATRTRGVRGGQGGGYGGQGGGYGPGGGGGGYGPGGGGGFGGGNGGFGGGGYGGPGADAGGLNTPGVNAASANLQSALVQPALDPPLPPGSADSIEARMAQRRAQQVGN